MYILDQKNQQNIDKFSVVVVVCEFTFSVMSFWWKVFLAFEITTFVHPIK